MFISFLTAQIYTKCMKPVLFQYDPEKVHQTMVKFGRILGKNIITNNMMRFAWSHLNKNSMKKIDGILFPSLVGLAAGFDYDGDLIETLPSLGFGFHTVGTVTLESYEGNPPPRMVRFPKSNAILVNKGLKNAGAKAIIAKLLQDKITIPLGISIASTNRKFESEQSQIADIISCFQLFEKSGLKHAYYELNISCPNTFGGEPFTTPKKLQKLIKHIDQLHLSKPVYVKMPIDQQEEETLSLLKVLNEHNVQGVIFGNLTKDHSNPDVNSEDKAQWKTMKGNISGKPTWKRSNACIALCRKHFGTRFTIIGTGGIFSAQDAKKKIESGADLVQLITGLIYKGPQLVGEINTHLSNTT